MFLKKLTTKKFLAALAISSSLITGIGMVANAQNNPGLTIFSGIQRENILRYYLDFGGRPGGWDRYRLRIPGKKLTQGAAKFIIVYPDYYEGKFDTDSVEVRIRQGKKQVSLPLREVIWDKESQLIEITLEEPITESRRVELVLSNVKNPDSGGTFYFHCQILAPGEIPVGLYLGTWILSIGRG